MNKFKKVGLTALAGSLAMSAHAADMSVSGANATYVSKGGANTGNHSVWKVDLLSLLVVS